MSHFEPAAPRPQALLWRPRQRSGLVRVMPFPVPVRAALPQVRTLSGGPPFLQARRRARRDPTWLHDFFRGVWGEGRTGVGCTGPARDSTAGSLFLKRGSAWFPSTAQSGGQTSDFGQMSSGGAGATAGAIFGCLKWMWLFERGATSLCGEVPRLFPIKADLFCLFFSPTFSKGICAPKTTGMLHWPSPAEAQRADKISEQIYGKLPALGVKIWFSEVQGKGVDERQLCYCEANGLRWGRAEAGGGNRKSRSRGSSARAQRRTHAGLPGPPVSPGCGSGAALSGNSPRFRILAPARNLAPRELPSGYRAGFSLWNVQLGQAGEVGARGVVLGELLPAGFQG